MLDPRTELSANRAVAGTNYSVNGSWGGGRSGRSHERYGAWNGGGDWQFGGEAKVEEESGVCSPPLWKTSPPGSPKGGNSPPHRRPRQNHYRSLSPASRMQAIAQGQRELMEMVHNMPESCYELSLRDLVEQPVVQPPHDSHPEMRNFGSETAAGRGKNKENDRNRKKNVDSMPTMARSGSLDNGGFLLKMVFPVSFRSKNKKKKNSATNTCSKVSPKPLASDGSAKTVDKEWWKKRVTVAGDSDGRKSTGNSVSTGSSRSSSSSSSSSSICSNRSSRHLSGLFTVCWSYFISKKRKTKE